MILPPEIARSLVHSSQGPSVFFAGYSRATIVKYKTQYYFLFLGDPIEFAGTALNTHNRYRLYHHAQPLKWSDKLSSQANKIAYQMAQQFRKTTLKRFGVPDEETVGENVEKFLGVDFSCDSTAAMKATDKWYQV